jgi:AbrB family looped-hinge helix DNA binding protein
MQIVTITSQGQVTIPAKMRRNMGFKTNKAVVEETKEGVLIKPQPNIMDLAGALHKYAIKNKSIDEIIELEEQAWGDAVAEKYKKSLSKLKK